MTGRGDKGGYLDLVEEAVRATAIQPATTFSWFGKSSNRLPDRIRRVLSADTARQYLLYNLQARLYTDFYCQGEATPWEGERGPQPITGMTPFVERLVAANSGTGFWADGWQVQALEGERVVVDKLGVTVWARPDDCRPAVGQEDESKEGEDSLAPGTRINLRFPAEAIALSPGYYMALGDNRLRPEETGSLVRFYWHMEPACAEPLMRAVTTSLNEAGFPFRFKALNDVSRFTRCDAAVLYVRKADYQRVASLIEPAYRDVAGDLLPSIPALTKHLAPGLGFAEDPGGAQSFGQHRCHILADGIIRAHEEGKKNLSERMQVVEECFAEAGIDLRTPFLNPGSSDTYEFSLTASTYPAAMTAAAGEEEQSHEEGDLLATAIEIGRRICQDAIWYEGRCNWMGAHADEEAYLKGQPGVQYRALGPDLYDGAAGIGLFLAALYSVTRDDEVRRTALGAIRQALARAEDVPALVRLGLYTGWPGIALAASRAACYLGEGELAGRATALLKRCIKERPEEQRLDLLSGSAGAIVALLSLRGEAGESDLLDFAIQLGDDLLDKARVSDRGYSWSQVGIGERRDLTGFSHGAAGIGYALLKLYSATGDERYRAATEGAFRYERSWFDQAEGNWPDFREPPGQDRRRKLPLAFGMAWCHGAPGIALSRLGGYSMVGDELYRAEALAALETTAGGVERALASGPAGFSLCHGLAGNADILRTGGEMLGQEPAEWADLPLRAAREGIGKYAAAGRSWPSGVKGGETPTLMLGLAGTGYFYLRMHDPSVPSVLLI